MLLLIGFGGNRGDVFAAFASAVAGLSREVRVLARSSVWRSAPLGPPQEDFLNAAVLVEARAHPRALLALCQRVEAAAGRDRGVGRRWGPRPLDLDLLIAPGVVVESPELVLPHPRLAERRFALAPAAELAPDWVHSRRQRSLSELAASPAVATQRCAVVVAPESWPAAAP
ncbi:MAG: 2-amino-4-hydroxy-6-hydroxymethyldihydropteridine diphosphokinase [Thermoanaerobaculaceae bacterium]|jgi:2-amino-4-hydroxy-6-hydroxymethyldihydropteridine diphosphokinase